MNVCIEFDGELHFRPIERFGGEKRFETYKLHDEIKNEMSQRTYSRKNIG